MNNKVAILISLILLAVTPVMASADTYHKTLESDKKAFLGVAYQLIDTKQFSYKTAGFGYHILRVLKDTAADVIGLKAGDIIIRFDNQDLQALAEDERHGFFSKHIKSKRIGDIFNITLLRQQTIIISGTQTKISNIEDLKNRIDNQGRQEVLSFRIDKSVEKLYLSTKLGTRQTVDEQDVPKNSTLFPAYELLNSSYTLLASRTILDYDLGDAYDDLLKRYHTNQLWDQGFRLNLFRYLHRDPLKFTPVMDTRLTALMKKTHQPFSQFITETGSWIDVSVTLMPITHPKTLAKKAHFDFIIDTLNKAEALRKKAFFALSDKDIAYLKQQLPELMTRFGQSFYIDRPKYQQDQTHNINLIKLTKKIDFTALLKSAHWLSSLNNEQWLTTLAMILKKEHQEVRLSSDAGDILLGGFTNNHYKKSYALIIDVMGDDIYSGASGIANNSISLIIDLIGNDQYQHTRPYAQGSAFFGVGILYDVLGDDIYTADSYAQGFSMLGIGMLIDQAGDDKYFSNTFSQGASFWGIATLLDQNGNDNYQANLYAQGLGGVKGLGVLIDNKGDDFYFATGGSESSYGVSGIFKGIAQGAGIGFRGYASGGIGLLLDGDGKDVFRAGNFSQGMGYFYGLGAIKNFGTDDDTYLASRYSQGTSAHSAMGILIDDGGHDTYHSLAHASQSAAWDLSLAALWDKSGNDNYIGTSAFASHNAFSLFIDASGTDTYKSISGGEINDYHGGVSFGIFIDQGGQKDNYPAGYDNNQTTLLREYGIFLDLPASIKLQLSQP